MYQTTWRHSPDLVFSKPRRVNPRFYLTVLPLLIMDTHTYTEGAGLAIMLWTCNLEELCSNLGRDTGYSH
jgi:hypothetical protein